MAKWNLLSNIQEVQGLMALEGLDAQEHPREYLQAQLQCTTSLETHAEHQTSWGCTRACPPAWVLLHRHAGDGSEGMQAKEWCDDLGKPQRPRVFLWSGEDTDAL